MALTTLKPLIASAKEHCLAVGAFSVSTLETVQGVLDAAEAANTPVILQIAERRAPFSPIDVFGPLMVAAAKQASVPVCVQLDHGQTLDCIKTALAVGFTSVMFDGSALPLDENIQSTRAVVKLAREYGATVEAEIGRVGRGEDGTYSPGSIASADDCAALCEGAEIDALAVGIGTAHGPYAVPPDLRYDVLEELNGRLNVPLVLHGGTGLTDAQFVRLIALGMRKVNIATDIFIAAATAEHTADFFKNMLLTRRAVERVTARYIALFSHPEGGDAHAAL